MQRPEDPTLLQSTLLAAPLSADVERSWAFLVYCGVIDPSVHEHFISLAAQHDATALADAVLDHATPRAELLDHGHVLATRLWQFFEVGQSLMPETTRLERELDDATKTQPGVSGPVLEP
jgi:hypothetical protein